MWLSNDYRGVRMFVRGEFVAPRQWLIHATVASESEIDKSKKAASRRRTLSALWQGIRFESRVGRQLGAVAVRVVVDGDRDIASMFEALGKAEKSPGPEPNGSIGSRGTGIGARRSVHPAHDQSRCP